LITFSLNQGDIRAFISQVIRQRSAHDADTNDNDSFAQSIPISTFIMSTWRRFIVCLWSISACRNGQQLSSRKQM